MSEEFVSQSSLVGPPWRDVFGPIARHRTAVAATFLAVLTAAAVGAWLMPPAYVSDMTLVVRRDRVDPLVSPDPNTPSSATDVGESELLSEAEILRSRGLLEQVVLDAGLHVPAMFADPNEEARAREGSVRRLRQALSVVPIRRTTMIRVSYTAPDAATARRVLQHLSERYLDKHLAVHRSAGTQEFFGEQVVRAREELSQAQDRLAGFAEREQVVSPEQERAAVLQQVALFETTLQQARAEAADADRRLAAVREQLQTTPVRQVTAVRTGANGPLIGQLKARVLEMELAREELLRKFTPAYPPVAQLDAQLRHTREVLAGAEESAPVLDETTDQNPTHQWLRNEEVRIRTEREALRARAAAIARSIAEYQGRARRLDGQALERHNLQRAVAAAEEAVLLYQRKHEEARISDALDRTRIANVGVVDPPTMPASQAGEMRALILWLGLVGSLLLGLGAAYVVDRLRPVIASPRDVREALDLPVLATVSASSE